MPPSEKKAIVPTEASGARLDKWLAGAIPELSRSRLKALIEEGAVKVAGAVQRDPAQKVQAGQSVRVSVPEPEPAQPEAEDIDLHVTYEDEHLIVIDKPAGLVVHPAAGNPAGTLVNALLAHCGPSLAGIGGVKRPGIVHRIDKDTSGLLVVAKTDAAHAGLTAQFAAHTVERRYDALVWGVLKYLDGIITGNIGRSASNRKKMAVLRRGGKPAETGYDTVAVFGTVASHVQCRLKTGRTHQIRVHMSHHGHPLIGDQVYGRPRAKRNLDPIITDFPRQALHAATLGFIHPVTEKKLSFKSPLPDDMRELIYALEYLA